MWLLFSFLAAIFYSLLWLLARESRQIPIAVVLTSQFLYGPILLIIESRMYDFPWHQTWWWLYLLLPFVFIPLMNFAVTYALHETEVTLLKPLFGLSSIAALVVSSTFFGEVVPAYGIWGVFTITLGLLTLYHKRLHVWRRPGLWIALVGAFVFGINASVVAAVLQKFPHPFALSGLIISGHLLVSAPPALPVLKKVEWSKKTVLILFGLSIAMLGQDLLTLIALTMGPASYVVAIKRTSLLLTAFVGYVFLKERDQSLKRLMVASGLVVGGVVLLAL